MLLLLLSGFAQAGETYTYQIKGLMQAIDPEKRTVTIYGLTWNWADDFMTEEFDMNGKPVEYERPLRVLFRVCSAMDVTQGDKEFQQQEIKHVTRLDWIKKLNNNRAKVLTLERLPQ